MSPLASFRVHPIAPTDLHAVRKSGRDVSGSPVQHDTADGGDPQSAIADVLAQPGVLEVHSRNIADGCYMFTAVAG